MNSPDFSKSEGQKFTESENRFWSDLDTCSISGTFADDKERTVAPTTEATTTVAPTTVAPTTVAPTTEPTTSLIQALEQATESGSESSVSDRQAETSVEQIKGETTESVTEFYSAMGTAATKATYEITGEPTESAN